MPICPHCRVDNPPAARFCNGCGARLGEERVHVSGTGAALETDAEAVERGLAALFQSALRHGGGGMGRGEPLHRFALLALEEACADVAREELERDEVVIAEGAPVQRIGDVQDAIAELIRTSSFFVTYLELTAQDREGSGPSTQILQRLKRKNQKLPVVVIDEVADLRRRQRYLREGADLYLTKPTEERMQPGLVEQELASFAEELVLFADRAFAQWSVITGSRDPHEAGRRFYKDGEKVQVDRSFHVLKQLINELSNPNDISQVALTILRLADEYLDRGVLFVVGGSEFRGIGGFGTAGGEESLAQKSRSVRIPRSAASVLEDVVEKREGHRGKMRRTPANVELMERMGGLLPTEVLVLPLMHEFKVIGILYGDNAENRAPIDATIGLEIFLSQAGYAFGNAVIASRNAGLDLDR